MIERTEKKYIVSIEHEITPVIDENAFPYYTVKEFFPDGTAIVWHVDEYYLAAQIVKERQAMFKQVVETFMHKFSMKHRIDGMEHLEK